MPQDAVRYWIDVWREGSVDAYIRFRMPNTNDSNIGIQKRFLDERANDFLVKVLSDIGGTVAKKILREGRISRGSMWTFVPVETPDGSLYNFKTSLLDRPGRTPHPKPNEIRPVESLGNQASVQILNYLSSKDRCFIFEDLMAKKGDAGLANRPMQVGYVGLEPIYFLWSHANFREVEDAVSWSPPFPWFISFGSTLKTEFLNSQPNHQEVNDRFIDEFVSSLEMIIVGAYDNEGHLFWEAAQET